MGLCQVEKDLVAKEGGCPRGLRRLRHTRTWALMSKPARHWLDVNRSLLRFRQNILEAALSAAKLRRERNGGMQVILPLIQRKLEDQNWEAAEISTVCSVAYAAEMMSFLKLARCRSRVCSLLGPLPSAVWCAPPRVQCCNGILHSHLRAPGCSCSMAGRAHAVHAQSRGLCYGVLNNVADLFSLNEFCA